MEIRVCTNRTCARQGGREVLAALEGLAPPRVDVASCGCLGRCGAGPNFGASVSGGGAAVFGHVGTAARAAQLLEHLLGDSGFDAAAGLAALAAREKAEAALEKGGAAEAEALLTEVSAEDSPHSYQAKCACQFVFSFLLKMASRKLHLPCYRYYHVVFLFQFLTCCLLVCTAGYRDECWCRSPLGVQKQVLSVALIMRTSVWDWEYV